MQSSQKLRPKPRRIFLRDHLAMLLAYRDYQLLNLLIISKEAPQRKPPQLRLLLQSQCVLFPLVTDKLSQQTSKSARSLRPKKSNTSSPTTSPQPQFSTLDRTILRELQRSILARSSQFKMKHDKKHHPYRPDQVPYPRSYDSDCVDCDVWETVFCKQFSGSVTWHVFDKPPAKV